MKNIYLLFLIVFAFQDADAQFIIKAGKIPDKVSIINYSSIEDAGQQKLAVETVRNNHTNLKFSPVSGVNGNPGFTNHTYWLKFELHNLSALLCFYEH